MLAFTFFPGASRDTFTRTRTGSTEIVARDGTVIYEVRSAAGGYSRWVDLDAISPMLIAATIASEDANFFDHPGIDPTAIARAVCLDLEVGRFAYGGSTITQQLAKNLRPRPRTMFGKLREAIFAIQLERTFAKREILAEYLNRAYYGRLSYGVESAARRYFGKPASALRLDEAVLLAILPRAPTAYDPARHPARAMARRRHVLELMVARGIVERDEAERAAAMPIRLVNPAQHPRARHALDLLITSGEIEPGVARVPTSIDLELTARLEDRVRWHLASIADRAVTQAGIVVLDNATGEIRAMVGSRDYDEDAVLGAVNATTADRQPGSALKPFVYALAFERGGLPAMPVLDAPRSFRDYHPRAIGGEYHGLVSAREALGSSMNLPAVRTAEVVGLRELAHTLRAAGLRTVDADANRYGLSLALGSAPVRLVDLAGAYAMLARGGTYLAPRLVRDTDAELGLGPRRDGTRVLSPEAAFLTTDILRDPIARRLEFGLETPLDFDFEVAAKTGTSQSFCDNVVVGYTREVTVAVWVGNFDGAPMHDMLSMDGAAPLFRDAMWLAMEGRPRRRIEAPETLVEAEVCTRSGHPAGPHCPHRRREWVRRSRETSCTWHRSAGVETPREPYVEWLDVARDDPGIPGSARSIAIVAPFDGSTLILDPLIARAAQRVLFEASVVSAERVRFEIDGVALAEVGAPYRVFWEPTAGSHRLVAVALGSGPDVSTEVGFTIERAGGRHE